MSGLAQADASPIEPRMNVYPMADACPEGVKERDVRAVAASRGLVGAANNTKWNELISYFRGMSDWRPSYRSKSVEGYVSGWDVEWFYHLPFPFKGVQWLDIGLHPDGGARPGMLLPRSAYIDHTDRFVSLLRQIGLEFEVREDVMRIWGYLPKCYEDFPPT
jgi:hypothetical protein